MKRTLLGLIVMVSVCVADEADVLGVVIGKSGFQCGQDCAIGGGGVAVYGDGHGNYITSKGFAYQAGTDYIGSDNAYVTKSDGWFYGSRNAIPAGMAYMGSTSTFVGRQVVLRKP